MPVTSTYSRSSPRSPYGYSDMLRLHGANKVACEQHQQHYRSSTYTAGYQYYTVGTANTAVSYIHTDFQGSWVLLTDAAGQAVAHQAFDAWGRPRNPLNWAPLPEGYGICMPGQRGFTGHEHLQQFGLIDMKARLYDPHLGRFLAPDPYVQAPSMSMNFNRYAYCMNNPLKYTDPTGEFCIGAAIFHRQKLRTDTQGVSE